MKLRTTPLAGAGDRDLQRELRAHATAFNWLVDQVGTVVQEDGIVFRYQPTPTTKAAAATLTIAELLTRKIQYTGGVANLTLPTGTLMDAGILDGNLPADYEFTFTVINTGAGAATILTAAGLTLVGTMTVAAGASQRFAVRKTATNTFTVYRD